MKLVWLVHNIEPHDVTPFQRALWRVLVRVIAFRADGVLTLSPATLDTVRDRIPALRRKPALGVNHPAYPVSAEAGSRADELRQSLGLAPADRLVGYAGMLRPYKGLEQLVRAASGPSGPYLLIAGQGEKSYVTGLQEPGDPARMTVMRRRLDEAEFDAVLTACDLIVAPYRRYLHSGSLVHALSAGRPVLTPATPFAEGLAAAVGQDWVMTYKGELTPDVLERALAALPKGKPDLSAFAPELVGRQVAEWLRDLCGTAR